MQETMDDGCSRLNTNLSTKLVGSTGPFSAPAESASSKNRPPARTRIRRLIEPQLQFDIDKPGRVFRAFQVAAHPVQAVRHTREHARLALKERTK